MFVYVTRAKNTSVGCNYSPSLEKKNISRKFFCSVGATGTDCEISFPGIKTTKRATYKAKFEKLTYSLPLASHARAKQKQTTSQIAERRRADCFSVGHLLAIIIRR